MNSEERQSAAGPTAAERMINIFHVADETSLGDAVSLMVETNHPYGVLVDRSGAPQGLINQEDLERALNRTGEGGINLKLVEVRQWFPPLLVVPGEISLSAIVEAPSMTLLQAGAHGMVVKEGDQIIGVLPKQAIAQYLTNEYRPPDTVAGTQLAGPIETDAGRVVCAQCGELNELDSLDYDDLPWCVNRQEPDLGLHRFKPGWL